MLYNHYVVRLKSVKYKPEINKRIESINFIAPQYRTQHNPFAKQQFQLNNQVVRMEISYTFSRWF